MGPCAGDGPGARTAWTGRSARDVPDPVHGPDGRGEGAGQDADDTPPA